MHKLLDRQLQRTLGAQPDPGTPLARLLELVERAYIESDEHRRMVERSLAIMSEELHGRNLALQGQLAAVQRQAWVLENMSEAALLLNIDGKIQQTYAATSALFGREAGDIEGHSLEEYLRFDGKPGGFLGVVQGAWRDGHWSGDLEVFRSDGVRQILDVGLWVLVGEGERESRMLMVAHDVTDRRSAERRALQSQKLEGIGQLAAGVAHEINTPAQYVLTNLHFLGEAFQQLLGSDGAMLSASDREYLCREVPSALDQSVDGMQRISDIVRGIKMFAHPGGGERTMVDLNAELNAAVTVSSNEWKYVAQLTTSLDPDLPPVPSYPGELSHVFLNLIVNAAHAIGDAHGTSGGALGKLHLSSRRDGNWVEVRVCDNGPGIPVEIRSRVFDPFFTTKPVGKGSGQGLAICHGVVEEKHGGVLQFESAIGMGTTFIVRLPLDRHEAAERAAA